MTPYVSPALYRALGYGAEVTSDLDLYAQLQAATSLVNRHCNQPPDFDFRGGVVAGEQHTWDVGNVYAKGTQRIWPDKRPVLTCEGFRIQVTNTQFLDVSTANVFINRNSNYIEPVIAASSIGVWSYSAIPVAGLRVPVCEVDYTYGYNYVTTGELMFVDADDPQVWHAFNQFWSTSEITVYDKDGTPIELTVDYTVQPDEGTITLVGQPNGPYRIDYQYKLPQEVRDATAQVATQLGGNAALAAAGMLGLSGMRVEEVELRQSRDSQAAKQEVTGLAAVLLEPFRWKGFA